MSRMSSFLFPLCVFRRNYSKELKSRSEHFTYQKTVWRLPFSNRCLLRITFVVDFIRVLLLLNQGHSKSSICDHMCTIVHNPRHDNYDPPLPRIPVVYIFPQTAQRLWDCLVFISVLFEQAYHIIEIVVIGNSG